MGDTKRLRSYAELARDLDRELRSTLVEVLQEEDALSRASSSRTDGLAKKYDLNKMGD